jgi:4-hydroxy-3-polyprenylbenzoate decarboxylase
LFGAGQMMFAKYIIMVSGNVRIREYNDLLRHVFLNTDFERDLIFSHGPLDVLDHSSDKFSFGGKMGIDATEKTQEENPGQIKNKGLTNKELLNRLNDLIRDNLITGYNSDLSYINIPLLILSVNRSEDREIISKVTGFLKSESYGEQFKMIIAVDHTVDTSDYFTVAWQLLGNSDPVRDHHFISTSSIFIDGTVKAYQSGGFVRKWPNIVCSDANTIEAVDQKWESLGIGAFIPSSSLKTCKLKRTGNEEVVIE